VPADAQFCAACGSAQTTAVREEPAGTTAVRVDPPATTAVRAVPPPPPPPESPAPPAPPPHVPDQPFALEAAPASPPRPYAGGPAPRPAAAPNAGELVDQLARVGRSPGFVAAAGAAAIAAVALFVLGLVAAIAFPDGSAIGAIGYRHGTLSEAFGQMCQFAGAPFHGRRAAPALLIALPLLCCAAAAALMAARTGAKPPRARVLWGAATGVPFAVLMVVAALCAGDVEPSVGSSLGLGLVWGAIGGAAGAWWRVRRSTPDIADTVAPAAARPWTAALRVVLRPLAVALAVMALVGTVVWDVQTLREDGGGRSGRTLGVALVENSLGALDHGVHFFELGTTAKFRNQGATAILTPLPVGDGGADDLTGSDDATPADSYRLFGYRHDMAGYLFVPLLIVLMAIPALTALWAGFALARVRAAGSPAAGAAWGALVGPVWAVAIAILNAVVKKELFGMAVGDSVFVTTLVAAALLGALGGVLAVQPLRGATR
jgi:hypothetical protein